MWKAAKGLLILQKGHIRTTGKVECEEFRLFYRRNSSATSALFPDSSHEFDVHLHVAARSAAYNQLRPYPSSSRADMVLAASYAPLEQSLSTLDAALHNVPLLANPFLFPGNSDAVCSRRKALDRRWSLPLRAVATVEEIEERLIYVEAIEQESLDPVIQRNISVQDSEKAARIAARAKHRRLLARQRKAEADAWEHAVKEYRNLMVEMCRRKLAPRLPFVKSMMLGWFEPVRDAIAAELKAIDDGVVDGDRTYYGPYLQGAELPADMLAVIAMHKMMQLVLQDLEGGCIRVASVAVQIGDAVEQEARIRRLINNAKVAKESAVEEPDSQSKFVDKMLKEVAGGKLKGKWRARNFLKTADPSKPWSVETQAKIGCRLVEIVMANALVQGPVTQSMEDGFELKPAFTHILRCTKNRAASYGYGAIVCDPLILSQIDKSVRFIVMPYMPMLVPPRPWKGYANGGYLHLRSNIMRTHGSRQQKDALRYTPRKQLQHVFEALDTLGTTCWRINKPVLVVMEKIWKDGGRLGDLVDRADVVLPLKPEAECDPDELKIWRRANHKAKRTNSERHSQRCDIELKLGVARKLKSEEEFYFPHNVDFRGRAYPMHPHLNHLGSDVCRGILEFAKGRPLGKNGLRWLKIQIANLYANGADKLSFEDRVAFVEERLDSIFDSADRPLDGDKWWLEAEDPFQCLASCFELRDAIRSGSPEDFISHVPVHQDGSCNGLQHYAALGRDRAGAQAVNLIAGDAPADVYSGIAVRVRAKIEEDSVKDPDSYPNAVFAKLLMGHVDRKLVKQTVMTSVYGVTFVGARQQICNRLKDKGCIADDAELYRASSYAAKVTLHALGEMFKEARCIMAWLGDCAKVIAAEGEAVRWTTPLGLPVVQPYRKQRTHMVKTTLQRLALRTEQDEPVMMKRQRSAFPPNFVHSMDGTHMMMTALACKQAGLAFAGVHDSFWTHAADVDKMNEILRGKFVELYNQPILEDLLEGFKKEFPKVEFPALPERGDLDLKEVLKAPYFFN